MRLVAVALRVHAHARYYTELLVDSRMFALIPSAMRTAFSAVAIECNAAAVSWRHELTSSSAAALPFDGLETVYQSEEGANRQKSLSMAWAMIKFPIECVNTIVLEINPFSSAPIS